MKRYRRRGAAIILALENSSFAAITITEERTFEIWGVVTRSIRML